MQSAMTLLNEVIIFCGELADSLLHQVPFWENVDSSNDGSPNVGSPWMVRLMSVCLKVCIVMLFHHLLPLGKNCET